MPTRRQRTAPAPQAIRLALVRHGAVQDADGRCLGHSDAPLSPAGVAGVQALAAAWHAAAARGDAPAPGRMVSSDLGRAVHSARLLAAPWRLAIEPDPRVREMSFGEWEGRPWHDIGTADGARLQAWMDAWLDVPAPGGEGVADLAKRAQVWLGAQRSAATSDAGPVVVVSHAGWIRVLLSLALGRPLSRMFELDVPHAHATFLSIGTDGGRVEAWNVSPQRLESRQEPIAYQR